MPRKATVYGDVLAEWESMLAAMTEKSGEFPFLQEGIGRLQGYLDRAKEQVLLHEETEAQRRESSRELLLLMSEGKKAATFLRVGLRQAYGNTSTKLIEFGIQPLRRRTRPAKPSEPTEPEPEASAASNAPPSSTPPADRA
jgi:hypothetical protein